MGVIDTITRAFKGKLDTKTGTVPSWGDYTVEYTSAFLLSIQSFIAREISKLSIDHKEYAPVAGGTRQEGNKYGEIYEVLNFSPNGKLNNSEWKRTIAKRLASGVNVFLQPHYAEGKLKNLIILDSKPEGDDLSGTVVITSPFHVSSNTTLYDNVLTMLGSQLDTKKVKGFLKLRGTFGSRDRAIESETLKGRLFEETVNDKLTRFQEFGQYNGLGVLDEASEIVELKNEYGSMIDPAAVSVIKNEILSAFGISENLLNGTYSNAEYRHFFDTVIEPIAAEMEKEFTYKLLTDEARINRGDNTYERIVIRTDLLRFADISELNEFTVAGTNGAFVTTNEKRKAYGLEPIEGGDVITTNLNAVVLKDMNGDDDDANN